MAESSSWDRKLTTADSGGQLEVRGQTGCVHAGDGEV